MAAPRLTSVSAFRTLNRCELDQYQWSRNPRGIHNTAAFLKLNHPRYVQTRMGWIKLVTGGNEYLNDIPLLNANGVTPIIRLYEPKFGASQVTADQVAMTTQYIQAGARWFEFYNEPNLRLEWPDTVQPDYSNVATVIAPLMDHWLQWAEFIIELGGYPAFPALSETVGNFEDVTSWINATMRYLAATWYDRFRAVANNGLWVATHPYFYNHFYQEANRPASARPPEAEDGTQGGWHFEYPYDPITQADDPGRSVLGTTGRSPNGDPIGLTGMGTAFMQRFGELFGGGVVPVVGTEGGITPVPTRESVTQTDARFPPFTWTSHAEATLACFNWMATQAPPWMFGLTLWKENDYWADAPNTGESNHGQEKLLAVQRLTSVPPAIKSVPPLEALSSAGPGVSGTPVPGPGPMHGEPAFHALYFSPDLNPEWFFQTAHIYWDRFQPALLTTLDLIPQMPSTKSLAITLITTTAQANTLSKAITDRGANVYIDLIVADTPEALSQALNERIANGKRLG